MICSPGAWRTPCVYRNLNPAHLQAIADLAEDQQYIRDALPQMGLCAFVADGSILPRASGVSSLFHGKRSVPLPFSPGVCLSPLDLPHRGKLTGMGIRQGVTLIVGGGYHGKSTLLKSPGAGGIQPHRRGWPGICKSPIESAVKIRSEDGRSIRRTDISMFINDLPNGKNTAAFTTEDASGSTSQAANVVEAMEAGTSLLLIDEDTSATNFMVRDELMQRLIHRDMEPITPFIDRVRELYEAHGISTILVAGSSGAYFHVADTILQMDRYVPKDITALAKQEAAAFPISVTSLPTALLPSFKRCPPLLRNFGATGSSSNLWARDGVSINRETIDLRYVEQLRDREQSAALGYAMVCAQQHLMDGRHTLSQIVAELEAMLDEKGLESLCGGHSGVPFLARPRTQELFACFNRYRGLQL